MLCCVLRYCTGDTCTYEQFLKLTATLELSLLFVLFCGCVPVFAFIVLDFHVVSSVLCQSIRLDERLRSDLFCVEWDVKP